MPSKAIPTPQDDQMILQASTTKTATFSGAGLDLGAGFAPGGRGQRAAAVVDISALVGTGTYTLAVEESSDNSTFTNCTIGSSLTVTAVGVVAVDSLINKRYVRLTVTIGGTSPSITYVAWLNMEVQR